MQTTHRIWFENANRMTPIDSDSVDLVVTSPPYPMIEMWDTLFCEQSPQVRSALTSGDGQEAFRLMHAELDPVWREIYRVLKTGGFACINIGDATRTLKGEFQVYSNHSRILEHLRVLGFIPLPEILWRKQTNAPNKFMGAGMLPAGAYVTLEHEYILVLRKGRKRSFRTAEEKRLRQESAFFWEERNVWFSDVWFDVKGTSQELYDNSTRRRSAAFPFELASRLVNMYSLKGDLVLDPFLGTGTTTLAAMVAGRNSVGFEIDPTLRGHIRSINPHIVEFAHKCISDRIRRHMDFVTARRESRGDDACKYRNVHYSFPVMTAQEQRMLLNELVTVQPLEGDTLAALYSDSPQKGLPVEWDGASARRPGHGKELIRPRERTKGRAIRSGSERAEPGLF